jgi:hypothetical protein
MKDSIDLIGPDWQKRAREDRKKDRAVTGVGCGLMSLWVFFLVVILGAALGLFGRAAFGQEPIIPSDTVARIKKLHNEHSAFVDFFEWDLTADPTWAKPADFAWYAYQYNPDPKYLEYIRDPNQIIPDSPADTHNNHGMPWSYAMRAPYLDDATKAIWKTRLLALADNGALGVRLTDSDETCFAAGVLVACDQLFGTKYTEMAQFAAMMKAIDAFIDRAEGGLWIESYPQYDQNTFQWVCALYRLLPPDAMPKFPALLKSAARYIVWSTTPDMLGTEFHGDVENDNNNPQWYYRLTTSMMISSLLPQDDEDNIHLKNLIRYLVPKDAPASKLYGLQFSLGLPMLYFDPDTLPDAYVSYNPTGFLVAKGRGITIYRSDTDFITVDMRNHTFVDHDESGGFGNVRWYHKMPDGTWKWILTCPGGYQSGPQSYNCPVIAGAVGGSPPNIYPLWTAGRKLVSADPTDKGFITVGKLYGPWTQAGSYTTWSYLDQLQRTVSFDGAVLTIKDEWIAGTGPREDTTVPFYQGRLFIDPSMIAVSGSDSIKTGTGYIDVISDKQQNVVTVNVSSGGTPPTPVLGTLTLSPAQPDPPPTVPPVVPPAPPAAPRLDSALFEGTAYSITGWFTATDKQSGIIVGQTAVGATPGTGAPAGFVPVITLGSDGYIKSSMFWHGDVNKRLTSKATYNDGKKHHVAVTYDGTAETLYLDGEQEANQTIGNTKYADSYLYFIGTGYDAGWPGGIGWNPFTGQLEKVTGYNKALTADEVKVQYSGTPDPPPPSATVGPWVIDGWKYDLQSDGSLKQSRTIPLQTP